MNFAALSLLFWCICRDVKTVRAEDLISATTATINGGCKVTIEIVMTEGRFFNDQEDVSVSGEKWQGQFEIRIRRTHKLLFKTSLNQLLRPKTPLEPLFFWAPKFKLALRDYKGDGSVDFNLFDQYDGSMYNQYRIFSVRRDGSIKELPVDCDKYGNGLVVSGADHMNSTRTIKATRGLMSSTVYDRGEDSGHSGFMIEERAWKRGKFVLVNSKPGDWPQEDRGVR